MALHRRPRRGLLAPAAALTGVAVLGLCTTAATTGGTAHIASVSSRVAGVDRYSTAAAVSKAAFPSGASVVYVATGEDFPDVLAADGVSGGKGPVLLTMAAQVPTATKTELGRLHPTKVVVVGGASAVSDATFLAIASAAPTAAVARVAGVDRYATAAALSQRMFPNGSSVAWLVTGRDWPDAVAAASAAGGKAPVLLVNGATVPAATTAELKRLNATKIHVVGGISTIPSSAKATVESAMPNANVDRMAGGDRYATAAAVSSFVFPPAVSAAYVATGDDFPDPLSAAAAASGRGPVLLVGDGVLPTSTATELQRLKAAQIVLVGGTSAISANLATQIQQVTASAAQPPVSAKASVAVATAKAQLGKPYAWAGAGPDSFDCSGLTMYAWAAAGVTLPHNSQAQYDKLPPVATTNLQPGDLVFFGTPANVYHVGIYIGSGQMIEAAHTGTNVRTADIHRVDLLSGGRPA